MNTEQGIPKAYQPNQVEELIYQLWLDGGYFTPQIIAEKKPFVIIMPPPNVTGELHMGHALTATLEDIMVRWHRMRGEPTLWLPGTDHAGIATQVVVEQQLAKEGITKNDLGREKFLERVWQWVSQYRQQILNQHQKLGASCDWSRERFTLDEKASQAVLTTFVQLYQQGLIYRGERIINWCPRCGTALSDLEVEYKELSGHLYYINYPLKNETAQFITVATTRPETLLGDTAIAVSPKDKRFQDLIGKEAILPLMSRPIPIIADEAVDPEFGTGAVKVTPAHDPVDFEIGQRHQLPSINILNPDATMNENAGNYAGLERFACREAVLTQLEKEGLLVKLEPYHHSVGHCARCNAVVEPWLSQQWFITTEPLAQPAIQAVLDGEIAIIPEQSKKVYLHWMENIRDWCISRQLWWGHQIPAWYCSKCHQVTIAIEEPSACYHCGSAEIYRDPDVLDTWFSSALWPHSTLGWPEETEDFKYFYPTTVMETGYDILFFWVARMITMGLANTGKIPFSVVYLHGLIRDESGEKMSKVKGNVVDPLEIIQKYGADALRFALSVASSPGTDVRISRDGLEGGRNFANKLWNTARFILISLQNSGAGTSLKESVILPGEEGAPKGEIEDRWILSRQNQAIIKVNQQLENFQFGEAAEEIYQFIWGEFCDWYVELAKIRLRQGDYSPLPVLVKVMETSLRLLHPFMPFITEEIWQRLIPYIFKNREDAPPLIISPFPTAEEKFDLEAEAEMSRVFEIIRAIRNARAQSKVAPSKWITAEIFLMGDELPRMRESIESLARTHLLEIHSGSDFKEALNFTRPGWGEVNRLLLKGAVVILPSLVKTDVERERLEREKGFCQEKAHQLEERLRDEAFLSKAPASVIAKERQKLSDIRDKLARIESQLEP